MTGSLRSTAKNPLAIAIMGALILVFLLLGVGGGHFPDAFRSASANSVVSVGSHSMSATDFQKIWERQKQKFEQQSGQDLTNQFLVQNGVDVQLLNQIALQQAALEMLTRAGIAPSSQLIDNEVRKLPWAFDRVTGQFSQQQFVQVLASQGLTPREALAEIGDELAERHFGYAAAGGFQAPFIYAAVGAEEGADTRDVSYFILPVKAVPMPAQPTDAQLQAFIKAHSAQLMQPEMRVITLIRFSAKALAPTVKIDPAQVAKEYAFRKDSLSTPETRTVIDIPVKTQTQGQTVEARLKTGEAPAAIAKSLGVEPIIFTDKPQSAITDGKLAQAAFALPDGGVSGPVAGDLGLAVVKVTKVTAAVVPSLAQATPQITSDLRQKQAADLAYQQSSAFDAARQTGASDLDSAKKAGVAAVTLGPVTAKGLDADGKPDPLLTPQILKTAFAQPAGQEGDLVDVGSGEYFALKVDQVRPPALPSVNDKRAELSKAYVTETLIGELKAKADQLTALAKKTGNLKASAAQVGAKVQIVSGMQQLKLQQYQPFGSSFLEAVFGAGPGQVFAAGGPSGVFIARVDAIHAGDAQVAARLTAALRGRVSQAYGDDLLGAVQTAARKNLKVDVNLALARQTLGVDPNVKVGADAAAPAQ